MAQLQTQFAQTAIVGALAMKGAAKGTIVVQIDTSSAGSLLPGQPVKIVSSVIGGCPKVVECASDGDDTFGFINYAPKNQSFNAGDYCEVSYRKSDNIMWMAASGAIACDAQVMTVISLTAPQVTTCLTGGTHRVIGRALDQTVNAGDLTRVWIDVNSVDLA